MKEDNAIDSAKHGFASGAFDADKSNAFDAEVVLLALGTQLTWLYKTTSENYCYHQAQAGDVRYSINLFTSPQSAIDYYRVSVSPGGHPPFSFPSLAAAKAACERHRATGKWEQE